MVGFYKAARTLETILNALQVNLVHRFRWKHGFSSQKSVFNPKSPKMPVSQQIDWSGIETAAQSIGIREAARQAAAHLPQDQQSSFIERIRKRLSRKRKGDIQTAQAAGLQVVPTNRRPDVPSVPNVPTGTEILRNTLENDSRDTKIALALASRKASQTIAAMDGDEILLVTPAMKDVATVAEKVHGWSAGSGASVAVQVNIMNSI